MGWRVVAIEKPSRLSLKDNKLVIEQDEPVQIPLEDIDSLDIDGDGIVLTKNIITSLADFGVNVLLCDEKHLPCSVILPYSQASRGVKNAKAQINMLESSRKQLWRKNIMQKIESQADVLQKNGYRDDDLRQLAKTVRSGDVGNNESVAARLYFDRLLGDATRRKSMWINSALNYGYAIVRSLIAREVASRGLITEIGINHRSELNQFNLVDDLIECYRPIIDDYVLREVLPGHTLDGDEKLTQNDRHVLIDILNKYCIICNKKFEIKNSVGEVVDSFIKAIYDNDANEFELPRISK